MPVRGKGPVRFQHASHVAWRKVEKESVVLDLDTSVYYSLNEISTLIWERLGAGASLEDIREEICAQYRVAPSEAMRDLQDIVRKLGKEKILIPR